MARTHTETEPGNDRNLHEELMAWSPATHYDYCPCSPKNNELKAAREATGRESMRVVTETAAPETPDAGTPAAKIAEQTA